MLSLFQNVLHTLRGRPGVSPRTWPPSALAEPPSFDSDRSALGPLHFGDTLEHARVLGRPDRFTQTRPDYCELLYARAGLQIDFDAGRFAYVAFFIGPDKYLPTTSKVIFAQPVLDGHRLSSAISIQNVERLFGPPKSRDVDDKETILFYEKHRLTLEFEFTSTGFLKRLNIYPVSPGNS